MIFSILGSFTLGVLLSELGYKTNSWQFWVIISSWSIIATCIEVRLANYKKNLKKQ